MMNQLDGHSHKSPPVSPAQRWLLRDAIVISAILSLIGFGIFVTSFSGVNDFVAFWSAARWVTEYGFTPPVYDYETFSAFQTDQLGKASSIPFVYPPSGLAIFAPLGGMEFLSAMVVFLGASVIAFVCALSWNGGKTWLAVLLSPATLMNTIVGQTGYLTAALLVGGLRLVPVHPVIAGALFGILTIKPQLGILVPVALVAARQWASFLGAALSASVLILVSLALGGFEIWSAWLDMLPGYAAKAANHDSMTRIMISPAAVLATLGLGDRVALLGQIFVTLIVAVVIWRVCRDRGLTQMTVAAVCCGTLLVTPYGSYYDLTITAGAAVLLTHEILRKGTRSGEAVILIAVWVLPMFAMWRSVFAPIILVLLFLAILRRIYGDGPQPDIQADLPSTGGAQT